MTTLQWIEMVVGLLLGSVMVVAAYTFLHNAAEEERASRSENDEDEA